MIIGLFPELLSSGGVQRVGRHVAAALARYAEQCRVRYRFLSLNDRPGVYAERVGDYGFKFSGYGRAKGRLTLAALRLAFRSHIMVVSTHPNLSPIAWAMKTLAPRLKSVVLTHGVEVWAPLGYFRRSALRAADLVLAPSAYTASRIVNVQGVPEGRVRHLPWGLDPEFSAALGSVSFKHPGDLFPGGRVVLTVGRWAANERYKGLDVLIQALPRVLLSVPDVQLVVVGDGDDRPRLEQLAKERDLTARVRFLGAVGKNELVACYQRCDVFAMPSRGEGFGLVFLEAMGFGKPVVGPNYGAPAEFIRHGDHGLLVDPEDPEAVARALVELLTSPDRAVRMGQAARQWAMSEYSYDRFHDRFLGLLRKEWAA